VLNNQQYILGIYYLSHNSIRKIRLSGNILEDITDTVLPNNTVKRVSGSYVTIINQDTIVSVYKDYKLSPIKVSRSLGETLKTGKNIVGIFYFIF